VPSVLLPQGLVYAPLYPVRHQRGHHLKCFSGSGRKIICGQALSGLSPFVYSWFDTHFLAHDVMLAILSLSWRDAPKGFHGRHAASFPAIRWCVF
jgi:hypothetical protein